MSADALDIEVLEVTIEPNSEIPEVNHSPDVHSKTESVVVVEIVPSESSAAAKSQGEDARLGADGVFQAEDVATPAVAVEGASTDTTAIDSRVKDDREDAGAVIQPVDAAAQPEQEEESTGNVDAAAQPEQEEESTGNTSPQVDEEEQEECGFCLFMKAGPCGLQFVSWQDCVDGAEKSNKDIVAQCAEVTNRLRTCMESSSEYYGPLLEAEKAMEAELNSQQESAQNDENSAETTVTVVEQESVNNDGKSSETFATVVQEVIVPVESTPVDDDGKVQGETREIIENILEPLLGKGLDLEDFEVEEVLVAEL